MGKIYISCSFDDGDICDLRLAELMYKYNIKGTFYIPQSCDLVSKILANNQIKELANSFEIGGHTISHQVLTDIPYTKAWQEIKDCKTWLEDVTGKQIQSFCPPTGRFDDEHVVLQKKAGFTSMRTVEMLASSFQRMRLKDQFVIMPTTTQVYDHTFISYFRNLAKRLNFGAITGLMKLFDRNWEEMSSSYLTFLNGIAEAKDAEYYFHLWGHSWEIDKYSSWNRLEHFFKHLPAIEGVIFCSNAELAEIARINGKQK